MKKILLTCCTISCLVSCISTKKTVSKRIATSLNSAFYENQFTGFLVVNANTKDTLFNRHSQKYFTPASNTKIFTLYTALKTLPKKIPALQYLQQNDTLYFEGTGDPSFLHPYLKDSTAFHFLKKQKNLAIHTKNFRDEKFGPGWAWEDYDQYYSPERSGFPVYGNAVLISGNPYGFIIPHYFKDSVFYSSNRNNRAIDGNKFYFNPQRGDTLEVPFKTGPATLKNLLEHAIDKKITLLKKMPIGEKQTLYGIESDSLYKRLMHESDNFIAEQLLILSASELTDGLESKKARTYTLDKLLPNIPQQPKWVDGSGLSRYNLFTPQSMVYVLEKLYSEISKERLFTIFPSGGVSGTIKNEYSGLNKPYLYAKSGSLGNNYCLSGYLITTSGKTLIFSFMNNHFKQPSSEVKKRMELIFEEIRDTY